MKASEKTGEFKYEKLAMLSLSPFWVKFTSISMIASMLGFAITYIIYIKTLLPHIVLIFVNPDYNPFEPDPLPEIFGNNRWSGQIFYTFVYSFLFAFPLSVPRSLHNLWFSSLIGLICAIYLAITIPSILFFSKSIVNSISL